MACSSATLTDLALVVTVLAKEGSLDGAEMALAWRVIEDIVVRGECEAALGELVVLVAALLTGDEPNYQLMLRAFRLDAEGLTEN